MSIDDWLITHYTHSLLTMRLDVFLKLSRLCPRRSVAQQLCDAGFVFVNGRSAKPAHAVKIGDVLTVRRRNQEVTVRILKVPAQPSVARRDANSLIEIVDERELVPDL